MTSRKGQPWTGVDDEELRRLIVAGEPITRIARQLGRTQEAVSGRKHRLGIRDRG